METDNKLNITESWWHKALAYIIDALTGPSISAFLITFTLDKPSELLTGFIYFLGFGFSGLKVWLTYRVRERKMRLMEKVVYREQDGQGKIKGGIIDSNTVGVAEWVSRF